MRQRLVAAANRWMESARRIYAVDVIWRAGENFSRQGDATYAAAVSYYALFSIFPLLIVAVSIFGLVIRDPATRDRVVDAILDQLPAQANLRTQVEEVIEDVAGTSGSITGLAGIIAALWTASGMFGALRRGLNRAFDVPGTRPFLHGKLMDLAGVLGVLSLGALSVAATAILTLVRTLSDDVISGPIAQLAWSVAIILLPFALSFITFVVVYRMIPNRAVTSAAVWPGAALAAVGFELAKAGFGLYVANFSRYQEVYGALGGAVAFMFFVFLVSNIVLFGAEVSSELIKDQAQTGRVPLSDPDAALSP